MGGYFTCNCVHLIWCRSLRLNSNKFRDSTYLKRGPTTSSVIQVLRNLFSWSSVRLSKKFALHNKPFARWRHFTTTTGILFVFPLIFKFGSPNKVLNTKSPNLHKKANPWRILVVVVKWRDHANGLIQNARNGTYPGLRTFPSLNWFCGTAPTAWIEYDPCRACTACCLDRVRYSHSKN